MTKQEEDAWLAEVDLHKDDYKWLDRINTRMIKRKRRPRRLLMELATRMLAITTENWRNRRGRRAY